MQVNSIPSKKEVAEFIKATGDGLLDVVNGIIEQYPGIIDAMVC